MPGQHDKATIISMAVIATAAGTVLHEAIGHGLVAWLRGDIPTELTSNHLSSVHPDRLVEAGGTLVNLLAGAIALCASNRAGDRANLRYFWWIFAARNLLTGAGYFLFSGIIGFGDWQAVIQYLPHQAALRIAMSIFGAILYFLLVWELARSIHPFAPDRRTYNTVGRLPYLIGCLFSCAAGALDPQGVQLFFFSTVPAAFGGPSGLLWADNLIPRRPSERNLVVHRQPAWWIAAAILGGAFILVFGPGIKFAH
jgi:hypothetical protein